MRSDKPKPKARKSPRQQRVQRPPAILASLLSEGRSYTAIAEIIGADRDVVSAWSRQPEIVEAVKQIQSDLIEQTKRRLLSLQEGAVTALEEVAQIRETSAAGARVRAAEAVLDRTGFPRLRELAVSGGLDLALAAASDRDLESEIYQAACQLLRERGEVGVAEVLEQLAASVSRDEG